MRYLVYARVSPKGSGHREAETSIERQVELCRQWVAANGGTVAAVVTDEAVSGKNLQRPGFARVLADLCAGTAAWDSLVFYGLDRVSRCLADVIALGDQLRTAGKGFASLREHLDLSTPAGRAMLYLLGVFAQFEREMCSQRTRDRMMGIAESGGWPGGWVPWGYRRAKPRDNRLVVDPETGPQVRQLFAAYVAGASTRQLRERFGLGEYSVESVCRILRNRMYLGKIVYGGREFAGAQPALVTPALFAAAAARLPGRLTGPRPSAWIRVQLLSGLLRCQCGRPMTTRYGKGHKGGRYYYYVCHARHACKLSAVRADKLEAAVLDAVRRAPDDIPAVRGHVAKARRQAVAAQERQTPALAAARRDLAAARAEEAAAVNVLLSGAVDTDNRESINARLRDARARIAYGAARVTELEATVEAPMISEAALLADLTRLRGQLLESDDPARLRAALQAHVTRIERLGPDAFRVLLGDGRVAPIGALGSPSGSWCRGYAVAVAVAV